MADLDVDLFFTVTRAYGDEDFPQQIDFERTLANGKRMKDKVYPDTGEHTIEFLYEVTYSGFKDMQESLQWPGHEKWTAWCKCLKQDLRTAWDEVVQDYYPSQDDRTTSNFPLALDKLVRKVLNHDKPRDVMLTWLAPNGGLKKDMLSRAETFVLRFKTLLRVTGQLPKGEIPMPNDKLTLVWFYYAFCKEHRNRYKSSGRDWEKETFPTLTKFFASQHSADMDSGALRQLIEKKTRKKLLGKRRNGFETDAFEAQRRTFCPKYRGEPRRSRLSRNNGRNNQLEVRYDRGYDRGRDNRRGTRRSGNRDENNCQPFKSRPFDPKKTCPKHGAGHSYEECRENPKNIAKAKARKQEREQREQRNQSHHQDIDPESMDERDLSEVELGEMSVDERDDNDVTERSDSSVECHALDELDRKPRGKKRAPSKKMSSMNDSIPKKANRAFTKMQSAEEATTSDMEQLQVAFEDDMSFKDMI